MGSDTRRRLGALGEDSLCDCAWLSSSCEALRLRLRGRALDLSPRRPSKKARPNSCTLTRPCDRKLDRLDRPCSLVIQNNTRRRFKKKSPPEGKIHASSRHQFLLIFPIYRSTQASFGHNIPGRWRYYFPAILDAPPTLPFSLSSTFETSLRPVPFLPPSLC